jgi:hypothetical protein
MKYKFKSGAEVEGTVEQILEVAKALGETVSLDSALLTGYYVSEHSGLLKISEMQERHLRNALLKRAKKFYEELGKNSSSLTLPNFLENFTALVEDKVIYQLFAELAKRK